MILQLITIARNTFVESIRQPIFFVLVMLCGLLLAFSTWSAAFSMGYDTTAEVSGDNKLLLDIGLATVFVCGTLLAAFIATAVVSREIDNRTVLTVVSKPVSRPTLVLGKYAGVAAALLLAVVVMLSFLLLCIRHGVLSTAADFVDGPVVLFAFSAIGLALAVAVWGNFLYGWHFTQAFMLVLLPGIVLAYLGVLLVSKHWSIQPLATDFKPQIAVACGSLTLAILVLTAVATAVSTRLGQVMTIVVCAGVFLMGLLSNHLIGRHAFGNRPIAEIRSVEGTRGEAGDFRGLGDTFAIELEAAPERPISPGASFYYGPNPNGVGMIVPAFPPFTGDVADPDDLFGVPSAVLVTEVEGNVLTVRNVGREPVPVARPPEPGDFVFDGPADLRPAALAVWAAVPNFHFFWLVDAVSQNRPVPVSHLGMVAAYAAAQIGVFLSLGVLLFQRRDVG